VTVASTARVASERPPLDLKLLCEHFADTSQRHGDQRFDVSFDDHEGLVDFAPLVSGTCRLDPRAQGVLALEARGADEAALHRIQRIVARHLARLGERDGLTVAWRPSEPVPPDVP
jgi:hypothetical protein